MQILIFCCGYLCYCINWSCPCVCTIPMPIRFCYRIITTILYYKSVDVKRETVIFNGYYILLWLFVEPMTMMQYRSDYSTSYWLISFELFNDTGRPSANVAEPQLYQSAMNIPVWLMGGAQLMTRQSQHDLPLSLAPSSNEQLMSTDGAKCLLIQSQHLNSVAMTINADLSKQNLLNMTFFWFYIITWI